MLDTIWMQEEIYFILSNIFDSNTDVEKLKNKSWMV